MMKNPAAQLQVIQSSPFRGELDNNLAKGQVALWWLGQAGFALQYGGRILLIDPYLSDLLARKYRDHMFSHERMMPTPIEGTDLRQVDWVLCTHRHSDHMDPGLLPDLAKSHPECRFILPAAEREHALGLGLPEGQLILMNDGMSLELDQAIKVRAIAAAHEELKTNERGEHHFLGYVIECGDLSIFHSGDGVPYDGLEERLASIPIDLALLPVNGRTPELSGRGFAGNFSLEESLDLREHLGIPWTIVHHFGMFAFNTADPERLHQEIAKRGLSERVYVPKPGEVYRLNRMN